MTNTQKYYIATGCAGCLYGYAYAYMAITYNLQPWILFICAVISSFVTSFCLHPYFHPKEKQK